MYHPISNCITAISMSPYLSVSPHIDLALPVSHHTTLSIPPSCLHHQISFSHRLSTCAQCVALTKPCCVTVLRLHPSQRWRFTFSPCCSPSSSNKLVTWTNSSPKLALNSQKYSQVPYCHTATAAILLLLPCYCHTAAITLLLYCCYTAAAAVLPTAAATAAERLLSVQCYSS